MTTWIRRKCTWKKTGVFFLLCMAFSFCPQMRLTLQAEEFSFSDTDEFSINSDQSEYGFAEDAFLTEEEWNGDVMVADGLQGTYTIDDGWVVDEQSSTSETTVYKQGVCVDEENTSTISCSYMSTNYSVLEYEQLRDMLTNNLIYKNVNAQISTSAVYTDEKDYLYILISDDTSLDYRDIYYYVVGDYTCFCVEVREYRAEADQMKILQQRTPQQVGQDTAQKFTWDTQW
ncbi:MAG: hypothetical protein SOX32_01195 [Candidatus Choladocola sp.]|nr:hypothetical protein [Candidatus Choladocola sp.]